MKRLRAALFLLVIAVVAGSPSALGLNQAELGVLVAFRQSITADPTGALSAWTNRSSTSRNVTDYCRWRGIQCSKQQHVVAIDVSTRHLQGRITPLLATLPRLSLLNLSFNLLQGPIPPQLANLTSLRTLDLHENQLIAGLQALAQNYLNATAPARLQFLSVGGNKLIGQFPPDLCLGLPKLRQLNLSGNGLSGRPALAGCTGLQHLDLSHNSFEGPVSVASNLSHLIYLDLSFNGFVSAPSIVGNNSLLTHLDLSSNALSGSILTPWIANVRRLTYLSLGRNSLSGTIPPSLSSLSSLSYLQLEQNHLEGQPLRLLLNCSNITFLALTNNSFSEKLPAELGTAFPSLSILVLILNSFYGTIPVSLGNCTNLQVLILGFNYQISGTIPRELFTRNRVLQQFDLQYNALQGSIPPEIGNTTSALGKILLNNNYNLSGSLPAELGNLANLEQINLEFNQFSGSIPEQLGNCTKFIVVAAYRNKLTGSIPSTMGGLAVLEHLILDNNRLSGVIPPSLSNCSRMTNISLNNNLLEGGLLTASFPSMLYLDVSNNRLSGSIPPELGSMTQVQIMDLSHNAFSGAIPTSLAKCVDLFTLRLSSNNLSGSIPAELGLSLQSLLILDISYNSISGSIPQDLGNLTRLQQLNLAYNFLSGQIPPSLASLSNLSFLNLSHNNLEGPIPNFPALASINQSSFLGNPKLCGPILHTTCPANRRSLSVVQIVLIIVAGCLLLALLFLAVTFSYIIRKRRAHKSASFWAEIGPNMEARRLTLKDIVRATNNFDEVNVVGAGGSAVVYRGATKDGRVLAFKKFLIPKPTGHENPLLAEAKSMANVRHRNLVNIVGYFSDSKLDILITEFMPNGTLSQYLHEGDPEWEDRVKIAVDIAAGLAYLHHDNPQVIVHLDVKPANILLDENMGARIADFGLARVLREANTHYSTQNMKGSLGYMAPEYASVGHISTKCDVYSFGIVLMEILTRKSPSDELFEQGTTLRGWVQASMSPDNQQHLLEVCLGSRKKEDGLLRAQAMTLLGLALECTKEEPKDRPSMQAVVDRLEKNVRPPRNPSRPTATRDP